MNRKYFLIALMALGMAACESDGPTPEPEPKPKPKPEQKKEWTVDARTVAQFVRGIERAEKKADSTAVVNLLDEWPVDSVANGKTLPETFDRAARIQGLTINKNARIIAADQDKPWSYADWNKYRMPIGNPKPLVANVQDSLLFANAGYPHMIIKETDAPACVINLTADTARDNFDALVADVPQGTPFIVKHNGHPLVVRDKKTLLRYAHPQALVPGAEGWSDTDPTYAEFQDIFEWSRDTTTYVQNRFAQSSKMGTIPKMTASQPPEDGFYATILIGGVTHQNIIQGTLYSPDGNKSVHGPVYATEILPGKPIQHIEATGYVHNILYAQDIRKCALALDAVLDSKITKNPAGPWEIQEDKIKLIEEFYNRGIQLQERSNGILGFIYYSLDEYQQLIQSGITAIGR